MEQNDHPNQRGGEIDRLAGGGAITASVSAAYGFKPAKAE